MNMHEEMLKLVADSYRQGGIDVCDAMIDAVNTLIGLHGDLGSITSSEVIGIVNEMKKVHMESFNE